MTAAVFRSSNANIFSMFSGERQELYPARREAFLLSVLGQAIIVAAVIYFMTVAITDGPRTIGELPRWIKQPPLVFSGGGSGGGSGHDGTPASFGALPPASPYIQLAPPTVHLMTQTSRLMVQPTIMAPELPMPSSQTGDPRSAISQVLSDGQGGRGGIGDKGCCGVGEQDGSGAYNGPHRAGIGGVTYPVAVFSPEPAFSNEARQSKTQGMVTLILVVDETGRTRDIRVQQSLGMGLDEKAIEAVTRWRFKPAMLGNKPVPVQIAVEVNFRLY